jgi:hypothetical protein
MDHITGPEDPHLGEGVLAREARSWRTRARRLVIEFLWALGSVLNAFSIDGQGRMNDWRRRHW